MNWQIVVMIIFGVAQLLLTVWLFVVSQKAGRIGALENSVTAKAEQVVETKFALLASDFKGIVSQLRTVIEGIEKRLERGDRSFDHLDEIQRELEVAASVRQAKCAERFATRETTGKLFDQLRALEVQVGKFEERLKHLEAKR